LYFGDMLLYPNLGDPVNRATAKELAFYISLYPAVDRPSPEATVELLHNGQPIATAPLAMEGALRSTGRVQQVGRLPLEPVPPGTYELRIRVSDGHTERAQSTFFTVVG